MQSLSVSRERIRSQAKPIQSNPMDSTSTSNQQDQKLHSHGNNPTFTFLDSQKVRSLLTYPTLIDHLQTSLSSLPPFQSPPRQHFQINPSSTLLLMPCWSISPSLPYIGVKIVTSFPENSTRNLPGINACYLLFNSSNGIPLLAIDGTEMTLWRTSCVSAIAARFLAREDSRVLVMIGAGSLSPYLIKAHLFVRPSLKKVIVWNRTGEKARELVRKLREEITSVEFQHGECLDEVVGVGDVVSCATYSENPLVKGRDLKKGAHLDLVGSFTPGMRECDEEAIGRGRVFVDSECALVEAGELVGAFEKGVISHGDVGGTLLDLIKEEKNGRSSYDEITVFKSVGSAVVDVLTAQLVYDMMMHG